ncbi:hypothetical protein [Salana multivorans]|nr:hypothetical protein [Salana multivorans]
MSEAGLASRYVEHTTYSGVVVPGYEVEVLDPTDDALIESCDRLEFYWINQLYQVQPSSIEANEEFANRQEVALRACLERIGVTTDPDSTGTDLVEQALGLGESGCLADVGIDTW